ncbi:thiamine pyrophosphate-binding protein [Mesorhizobium sp. BR1-1-13]|nr:thiamine pyrophosphate-binding protein [Mesorhizobium sp. BR1-1-13]
MPRNEPAGPFDVERPLPSASTGEWGSDVAADMLRALDIPFVALNPGASFRGLHDSLVNHLGNENPQMLLCLHEEHAVAIAHGWAKVTEKPMAAIVHSNVGLMHATMAVFNAWCDRAPLLLVGATGPVDAAKRRPWIDWIHTAQDQAALVRPYTKWDDQPASAQAAVESFLRAFQMTSTYPKGPTYICLDAGLQELRLDERPTIPDVKRFGPAMSGGPNVEVVNDVAQRLLKAKRPVILAGRVGRDETAWDKRVQLAEALGAIVVTDIKVPAAFPTTHRLHGAPAGTFLSPANAALLREADVILSLDWIDLAGTLKSAWQRDAVSATVIQVSGDQYVHNGWSMDYQGLPPADILILTEADATASLILDAVTRLNVAPAASWPARTYAVPLPEMPKQIKIGTHVDIPLLAAALAEAVHGNDVCLIRGPLSWAGHLWEIEHPLDYLGIDGGAGLGSGPGMAIGAALALRGSGRLPVAVFGDGDFMMGSTAIWTAVHYRIPVMIVVANNTSFFNDELHQERMARQRDRVVGNKWIGQRMADPDIDIAMVARAQGATGIGPARDLLELRRCLAEAVAAVQKGQVVVVDARVLPGYDANTTQSMQKTAG